MTAKVNPVWVSGHYKLIDRSNDTAVANWVFKAQDTAWTQTGIATAVGVVFGWGESAGQTTATSSGAITLQFAINGGAWTTVTNATAVQYANSAAVTDAGTYSTAYTTAPTGVASWGGTGEYDEDNSVSAQTPVDQYYEALFVLALDSAQLANGDAITFQILHGGSTFDSTDATPTLTYYEPVTVSVESTAATVVVVGGTGNVQVTAEADTVEALAALVAATGQTATLQQVTTIQATAATVVASGQTASFLQRTQIPATAGTVVTTGQSATIQDAAPATIECAAATVLASGQSATLRQTTLVPASAGTVVTAGQSATLRQTSLVPATPTTVVVTGTTASITETSLATKVEATAATVVATGGSGAVTESVPVTTTITCSAATVAVTGTAATVSAASSVHGRRVRRYKTKLWYAEPSPESGTPSSSVDGLSGQLIPPVQEILPPPAILWREKPITFARVPKPTRIEAGPGAVMAVGQPATIYSETRVSATVARIGPDAESVATAIYGTASLLTQAANRMQGADARELRYMTKLLTRILTRVAPDLEMLEAETARDEEEAIKLLLSQIR